MSRMTKLSTLALCLFVCVAAASANTIDHGTSVHPTPELVADWFGEANMAFTGEESIPEMGEKFIHRVLGWATSELTDVRHGWDAIKGVLRHTFSPSATIDTLKTMLNDVLHSEELTDLEKDLEGKYAPLSSSEFPYWGFIPTIVGSAIAGADPITFSTDCWGKTSYSSAKNADGSLTLSITVSDQKSWLCSDHYAALTVASMKFGVSISETGTHTVTWNTTGLNAAEQYDLDNKGVRLFKFPDSTLGTIGQVVDTALLFIPMTTQNVSASAAARNVKFMADYANRIMTPRTITEVDIPESDIQSGDFFGIIRLDGLDPMLAWAMGSTTGHTTIAVRDEAGDLYIHESTAKDSYWPTNGIQKTPFKQWISQARAAGFNLVHAPLNAEYRAKFNTSAALEFFATVEGLNYGYHNMLWGWIDTIKDNYPCVPPYPSNQCLEWDLVEVLFSVLNKAIPAVGELLFKQAWNLRLGTKGLNPPELYMIMEKQGKNTNTLPVMVEQDVWKYNTTRYGKPAVGESMVCCVFVCHMWKAAGIFGKDMENCGEFTNLDDYSLTIFETSPPPAMCQAANPGNPVCQLEGAYTLELNEYHTKNMFPYMAQSCPSMAPNYTRPANC